MLSFLITIADRALLPRFISLYREHHIAVSFIALGRGTATGELLDYFGLDRSEKAVCFSLVTQEVWRAVKRDLEQKLRIDVPGVGVAFTVPPRKKPARSAGAVPWPRVTKLVGTARSW